MYFVFALWFCLLFEKKIKLGLLQAETDMEGLGKREENDQNKFKF